MKSTRKQTWKKAPASERPDKPYKDFPLYAHPLGYWSKKIRGKIHHFGRWGRVEKGVVVRLQGDEYQEELDKALDLYLQRKDDLYAGRPPRPLGDSRPTVAELCDLFRTAKVRQVEAGELSKLMFADYERMMDLMVSTLGKNTIAECVAPADFGRLRAEMAKRWGPVRLGNAIVWVKSVFRYGVDNGYLDRAVRYGSEFGRPAKAVIRRHRAQGGEKMFEAPDLRKLIAAAGPHLKAMILLGINCGFGNMDCATLPVDAIDLDRGWIDFARHKTGIGRRCPLWPETVAGLRQAIACRPEPNTPELAQLVFLTSLGMSCLSGGYSNAVGKAFRALLKAHGLHRPGIGFYTLRHTFRTIADAARDDTAADIIMGHADSSMADHYRERVEDSRLVAVTERVRAWLFGSAGRT